MNRSELIFQAFLKREPLFDDTATTAHRLFHHSSDGIDGLTVDRYGDYGLIQIFDDSLEQEPGLDRDISAAWKRTGLPLRALLRKYRGRITVKDKALARKSRVVEGVYNNEEIVVSQNNCRVSVDLISGVNTGLFLDMREIRQKLVEYYGGQMLNLFCYTGMFSVHGLRNGISHAVNVDLSKKVLTRAKNNYGLNGFRADSRDFIYGDAFDWVNRFVKKGYTFDFIVLDPPTFARNAKKTFSVKNDYALLLERVELLAAKYVFTAVNTYTVSMDEYRSYHPSGWKLVVLSHESSDFNPESDPYLKAGLWEVRKPR